MQRRLLLILGGLVAVTLFYLFYKGLMYGIVLPKNNLTDLSTSTVAIRPERSDSPSREDQSPNDGRSSFDKAHSSGTSAGAGQQYSSGEKQGTSHYSQLSILNYLPLLPVIFPDKDDWRIKDTPYAYSKNKDFIVIFKKINNSNSTNFLELENCNIIFLADDPVERERFRRAIVIETQGTTTLSFNRDLNFGNSLNLDDLKSISVNGAVIIRCAMKKEEPDDDLIIRTWGLDLNKEMLRATSEIHVKMGGIEADGARLTINFSKIRDSISASRNEEEASVSPLEKLCAEGNIFGGANIEKIMLEKLQKLTVKIDQYQENSANSSQKQSPKLKDLDIMCQGNVIINASVETMGGWLFCFNNGVQVSRNYYDAPKDTLSCQTLSVLLVDAEIEKMASAPENKAYVESILRRKKFIYGRFAKLVPHRLRAERSEKSPVRIEAPVYSFEAEADKFLYYVHRGFFELLTQGKGRRVSLTHDQSKIFAESLKYEFGENGDFGIFHANSNGQVTTSVETKNGIQRLRFHWGKDLMISKDLLNPGFYRIVMDGGIAFEANGIGSVKAENGDIWFKMNDQPKQGNNVSKMNQSGSANPLIENFSSTGHVALTNYSTLPNDASSAGNSPDQNFSQATNENINQNAILPADGNAVVMQPDTRLNNSVVNNSGVTNSVVSNSFASNSGVTNSVSNNSFVSNSGVINPAVNNSVASNSGVTNSVSNNSVVAGSISASNSPEKIAFELAPAGQQSVLPNVDTTSPEKMFSSFGQCKPYSAKFHNNVKILTAAGEGSIRKELALFFKEVVSEQGTSTFSSNGQNNNSQSNIPALTFAESSSGVNSNSGTGTETAKLPGISSRGFLNANSDSKVFLDAQTLNIMILSSEKGMTINQLLLSDNVSFQEMSLTNPNDTLNIRSSYVEIDNPDSPNTLITLTGENSSFVGKGLNLYGDSIILDRNKNSFSVRGPGRLNFNIQASEKPQSSGLNLSGPLEVVWSENLVFDGQTLAFRARPGDDVIVSHAMHTLKCPEVRLTTVHKVDLFNYDKNRDNSSLVDEIALIDCLGRDKQTVQVSLFMNSPIKSSDGSNVIEKAGFQGEVQAFVINYATRDFSGKGPGWFRGVMKMPENGSSGFKIGSNTTPQEKNGSLALKTGESSNKKSPGTMRKPWGHLHLVFQEKMSGNLDQKYVSFQKMVQSAYCETDSQDSQIDASHPSNLPEKSLALNSNELKILLAPSPFEKDSKKEEFELIALGNVFVNFDTIIGRGYSLTYSNGKKKIILQGAGNGSPASLYEQKKGGLSKTLGSFLKASYDLETEQLEVSDYSTAY